MNGRVVNETDDGSLFSSCVIVRLQSTMSSLLFQERCWWCAGGSDAVGKSQSSAQLWLRSHHQWNKDGEVLRTGKMECCFLYWDFGRSGSPGMSESRSLCSEQKLLVCPVWRCSCPGDLFLSSGVHARFRSQSVLLQFWQNEHYVLSERSNK